jgi:hypothetical protein
VYPVVQMTRSAVAPVTCAVCILVGAGLGAFQARSSTPQGAASPFGERSSLRLNKPALRAEGAPQALLDKVSASAFRYFRMLARQVDDRACYEFRDLRWRLPSVAVHGDAHIEQFVVTDDSYGLSDFDRSGFGPSVVDLVRYTASIHLACREVLWPCDPTQAARAFFRAYREALDHPVARSQPAIVGRLRATPPLDRHAWLEWAEQQMQPLPAADEQALRREWFRFIALMRETSPERQEGFYRISRMGQVAIGIGSALEPKTLIRIAGPTDSPDDDYILEARITGLPDGRECVSRPANGGSLHVFMLTELLGHRLPEVFGFAPREGGAEQRELWIQSWDNGYREISVTTLRDQTDLDELANDAGTQLAGNFWTTFPQPLRLHQRFAQLRAFEMTEDRARDLGRDLAREIVTEWERFRRQR